MVYLLSNILSFLPQINYILNLFQLTISKFKQYDVLPISLDDTECCLGSCKQNCLISIDRLIRHRWRKLLSAKSRLRQLNWTATIENLNTNPNLFPILKRKIFFFLYKQEFEAIQPEHKSCLSLLLALTLRSPAC